MEGKRDLCGWWAVGVRRDIGFTGWKEGDFERVWFALIKFSSRYIKYLTYIWSIKYRLFMKLKTLLEIIYETNLLNLISL
jgi:hypothetical protein